MWFNCNQTVKQVRCCDGARKQQGRIGAGRNQLRKGTISMPRHTFSTVGLQRAGTYLCRPPMLVLKGHKMEECDQTDEKWTNGTNENKGERGGRGGEISAHGMRSMEWMIWQWTWGYMGKRYETKRVKLVISLALSQIQFMCCHLFDGRGRWTRPRPWNGMKANFLCKLQQWPIYVGKNFNPAFRA